MSNYLYEKFWQMFFKAFLILLIFLSLNCNLSFSLSKEKTMAFFNEKGITALFVDTIINKREMHYVMTGDSFKPLLVFIHGSPGSSSAFYEYLADSVLLNKYCLISIDRPGFGHSNYKKALPLDSQARLINLLLKKYANKNLYLCGHSLGGPLIFNMVYQEPNVYKKLIIIAGAIDSNLEKKENWRKVLNHLALQWILPGAFMPSNTELVYFKNDVKLLPTYLSQVQIPVLFIHGTNDMYVPFQNVNFGLKNLTQSTEILIDTIFKANHFIPWTHKSHIVSKILEFIK